jgi:hypothetical protein
MILWTDRRLPCPNSVRISAGTSGLLSRYAGYSHRLRGARTRAAAGDRRCRRSSLPLRRYSVYRGSQAGPLFQTRRQRGKARDGHLETRSLLRIVRTLGQRVGLHVWCHSLTASQHHGGARRRWQNRDWTGQGEGPSRHAAIGTLLIYADDTIETTRSAHCPT